MSNLFLWKIEYYQCPPTEAGEASVCTDLLPIVNDFSEQYGIEECESGIWNLLASAFSGSDMQYKDPNSISDSIFFCRNISMLLKKLNSVWRQQDNLAEVKSSQS